MHNVNDFSGGAPPGVYRQMGEFNPPRPSPRNRTAADHTTAMMADSAPQNLSRGMVSGSDQYYPSSVHSVPASDPGPRNAFAVFPDQGRLPTVPVPSIHDIPSIHREPISDDCVSLDQPTAPPFQRSVKTPTPSIAKISMNQIDFKVWDVFRLLPLKPDTSTQEYVVEIALQTLKLITFPLIFALILLSAGVNKAGIFLMTSTIGKAGHNVSLCGNLEGQGWFTTNATVQIENRHVVKYLWALYLTLCAPDVFCFIRCFLRVSFRNVKMPSAAQFFYAFFIETFHAIGVGILVFQVLPDLDAITASMLSNCLCFFPAVFLLLSRKLAKLTCVFAVLDIICIVAQSSGIWAWSIFLPTQKDVWSIPLALILCSIPWWENYVHKDSAFPCIRKLSSLAESMQTVRSKTYVIIAPWKCLIYLAALFTFTSLRMDVSELLATSNPFERQVTYANLYEPTEIHMHIHRYKNPLPDDTTATYRGLDNLPEPNVRPSSGTSTDNDVEAWRLLNETDILRMKRAASTPGAGWEVHQFSNTAYDALWIALIVTVANFLCYQCCKFACKIKIQQFSFAAPLNLVVPVLVFVMNAICVSRVKDPCYMTHILPFEIFWKGPDSYTEYHSLFTSISTWFWLLWLVSQAWVTIHIWFPKCERLADTDRLFVLPWYNCIFLDQSLSLNRRRDDTIKIKTEEIELDGANDDNCSVYETISNVVNSAPLAKSICSEGGKSSVAMTSSRSDSITRIYACATMWHENREEMLCMLKSIFRLDEDQSARRNAQKYLKIVDPDYYEFEALIMFDDAFEINEYGEPQVNRFVQQILEVIDVAAGAVHQTTMKVKPPKKLTTPYGGQLIWTLPGKNKLTIHLKDRNKIRVRKRWSQVMYMYYLLGHRLMEKIEDVKRKETIAENTYLLTLDGDVDFHPPAVHLLVDLMKKNKRLGAACGRIHPRGSGPMVWYQQFEYAIGHWFQKATEHMIGCVLCSPGCFSLFRSAALMDDNVLRRYATKSEKARDYVQYDQGEDRWLCTLLLQRGYRVEYCAASDALTFAPQSFTEFFNQRRRWIPSTVANIVDLLASYKDVVKLNDSISFWYIVYQFAMLLSSVLGPGTIFLMVAGAVNISFFPSIHISFLIVSIPVVFFAIVCFTCSQKWQLLWAQIISAGFGLLMTAVIVGTALQIKKDGIASPHSIFFMFVIGSFLLAACLHPLEFSCIIPGIIYFLAIPSTYMLLIVYSVCNLNIVSWGTREVTSSVEQDKKKKKTDKQKMFDQGEEEKPKGMLDRFLFCLQPFTFISMQIAKVIDKIDAMDRKVDRLDRRHVSNVRRQSSLGLGDHRNSMLEQPLIEEEEDDEMDDNFDAPYREMQREKALQSETWLDERCVKHADRSYLDEEEARFWRDMVDKYLYPLIKEHNMEQIATELLTLRNHISFFFYMANALFILIIFLLQLKKDCLYIEWPLGPKYNHSMIPCQGQAEEEVWVMSGLQLEPIGVVFLLFFMSILLLQSVAMLMHRFSTMSHILASTSLFCFKRNMDKLSEDELVAEHFVEIAKELQAIRGIDDESNSSMLENQDLTISRRRVVKSLENSRRSMAKKRTETLDAAFKKRFFALSSEKEAIEPQRPMSVQSQTPIMGGRARRLTMRRGTVRALETRRDSIFGSNSTMRNVGRSDNDLETGRGGASEGPGAADDTDMSYGGQNAAMHRGPARRRLDRLFPANMQTNAPRDSDIGNEEEDFDDEPNDIREIPAGHRAPRIGPGLQGRTHGDSSRLGNPDSWGEQENAPIRRSGLIMAHGGVPLKKVVAGRAGAPSTPKEQRSRLIEADSRQGSLSSCEDGSPTQSREPGSSGQKSSQL